MEGGLSIGKSIGRVSILLEMAASAAAAAAPVSLDAGDSGAEVAVREVELALGPLSASLAGDCLSCLAIGALPVEGAAPPTSAPPGATIVCDWCV